LPPDGTLASPAAAVQGAPTPAGGERTATETAPDAFQPLPGQLVQEASMAGYILAQLKISDGRLHERWREALLPLVDRMGGRLRVDGGVEVLEGDPMTGRVMVIEFQSRDAARLFYDSPEYEQIRSLRSQATDGSLWLLEGG
jgi:uncharacterized protein (DUF1330 family)